MPKKQKSGLYRTKITISYEKDGNPIVKYLSGKTKVELERAKREAVEYYVEGSSVEAGRLFGEYAAEWYKLRKEPFIEPSTRSAYRSMLNKHVLPTFGSRNLKAIGTADLQGWLNQFSGMSDTTITLCLTVLRGIFTAAVADRLLIHNPAQALVEPPSKPAKVKHALSPEERKRMIAVINTHDHGRYLACLNYLGVRPGEARGLQWGDFDWKAGLVHIERDIDYAVGAMRVGKLKSEKADRLVPIPDALRQMLYPFRGLPSALLFFGEKGNPLSKTTSEIWWTELMITAGFSEKREDPRKLTDIRAGVRTAITPSWLRHNYITMCWETGLDPLVTMRIVGHADYKTTMNIYTHLNRKHLQMAKEKIEKIFDGKEVAQKLHRVVSSESEE